MGKIQILGIGRDPVVLQKLLRFINENPNWEGTGTIDDRSAALIFDQRKYAIVVLIDNLSGESESRFRTDFSTKNPEVVFLNHYGDSTGLLAAELYDLIEKNQIKQPPDPEGELSQ